MKPLPVLLLLAAAAVTIGLVQRNHLGRLHDEHAVLAGEPASATAPRPSLSASPQSPVLSALAGDKDVPEIKALILDMVAPGATRSGNPTPEVRKRQERLMSLVGGLGHEAAGHLIEAFRADAGSLPAEARGHESELVLMMYEQANPSQAVLLIQSTPDLPAREQQLAKVFSTWSQADPAAAVHWYQEESTKGDKAFGDDAMKQSFLMASARIDPAKALAMEVDPTRAPSTMTPAQMGGSLASGTRKTSERVTFFTALDQAAKVPEDVAKIAEIRAGYVRELSRQLPRSSFDDATMILDTCFTADERRVFAAEGGIPTDAEELGRWMTWLSKADLPADSKHPVATKMLFWAHSDPRAAEDWLTKAAEGPVKDDAVRNYAWALTDRDPDNASKWVSTLPPSKERTQLVKNITASLRQKNPDAAAKFAAEHP